jgi:hypothetical protein
MSILAWVFIVWVSLGFILCALWSLYGAFCSRIAKDEIERGYLEFGVVPSRQRVK